MKKVHVIPFIILMVVLFTNCNAGSKTTDETQTLWNFIKTDVGQKNYNEATKLTNKEGMTIYNFYSSPIMNGKANIDNTLEPLSMGD